MAKKKPGAWSLRIFIPIKVRNIKNRCKHRFQHCYVSHWYLAFFMINVIFTAASFTLYCFLSTFHIRFLKNIFSSQNSSLLWPAFSFYFFLFRIFQPSLNFIFARIKSKKYWWVLCKKREMKLDTSHPVM